MQSLQRMSCIGASLVTDKPCRRTSVEMLLRQDASFMLRYVSPLPALLAIDLAKKLSVYAHVLDQRQLWYALDYLGFEYHLNV